MQELQYEKTIIGYPNFNEFIQLLEEKTDVKAAILFGSVARNDHDYQSDIDLAIWIDETEKIKTLEFINTFWEQKGGLMLNVERKKSQIIFTNTFKKIDLLFINELSVFNKHFLGSIIPFNQISKSILFDKTNSILSYLAKEKLEGDSLSNVYDNNYYINYFLFAFECCSKQQAKSDSYGFYFNYNIALHTLFQLNSIQKNKTDFFYCLKQFKANVWGKDDATFNGLSGTLALPKANAQKRKLLDAFYDVVKIALPHRLAFCQSFCEAIFQRDYFWNKRDFSTHFPKLSSNRIIRSATFSVFDKEDVINYLQKHNITTIIDLRAEREIKELPYSTEIINASKYIKAPFDPWNQPTWFKEKYHFGTNREIAYRFFLKACQDSFKKVVDIIIGNKGTILIHCHAGKDRTGLVLGAIQLLLSCDIEAIKKDYMASKSDSDLTVFQLLFDEVEFHGSIEKFFEYQGVSIQQQQELIKKLTT